MKVIDDFLPPAQFDMLQQAIMSLHFPWFYVDSASVPPEDQHFTQDKTAIETDGFFHILYDRETDTTSFAHQLLDNFYQQLSSRLGFTHRHLIRSRLGMKLPKVGFTKDNYNIPHVDYRFPHETLIYYINDCDGDTFMFNEWFNMLHPEKSMNGKETYTVQERITPKANRLVWFNGFQSHTASNPIESSRRIIINVNLEPL